MTQLHHSIGGATTATVWRQRLLDKPKAPGEERLVWEHAFVGCGGAYQIDAEFASPESSRRTLTDPRVSRSPGNHHTIVLPRAFEPQVERPSSWQRVYLRDVKIRLDTFRPFDVPEGYLQELGIPRDLGANHMVVAQVQGHRILMPSLALLRAIAMPSSRVSSRLMHPLNLDFMLDRTAHSPDTIDLVCTHPGVAIVPFTAADVACMVFWMTDRRLPSLWRALQGFGLPGWRLSLPDCPDELNFMFDGFAQDDLIVVQRLRIPVAYRFWPGDWEQVTVKSQRRGAYRWIGFRGQEMFVLAT